MARGIDFWPSGTGWGKLSCLTATGDNRIDAVLIQSYQTYQVKNVDPDRPADLCPGRDPGRGHLCGTGERPEVYLSVDMEEDRPDLPDPEGW